MSHSSNPHAHLLGVKVTIKDEVKDHLQLSWTEGVLLTAFETPDGLGIHVYNPETGEVTEAMTFGSVTLHQDALEMFQTLFRMSAMVLSQVADSLE